jgi:phosphoglucosamine mutase
VSASHNPAEYNGVKFFARGTKLTDEEEEAVEALFDAPGSGGGAIAPIEGLADRYADVVVERFGRSLDGLRVVLDCANGALSGIAPGVFERLAARVVAIGASPDGTNINDGCGATDLSLLARAVSETGADLGVAFDGDGDRMLAVDAGGREVDGDQIVAILALHLGVDLVAVTSMTNLGFHRLMSEHDITVITTDVGDRYVLEALQREGGTLGGEQSGHLLYLDGHVTGDGLVAALLLCGSLIESNSSLAEAAAVMPRWPQVKRNIRVRSKVLPASLLAAIEAENARLADCGRLLVRASGTEPVVRVLAEAERADDAERLCASMALLVEEELG